ncbi:MAG: glycosyltransferase family 39 protein [Dokdonella sp.]
MQQLWIPLWVFASLFSIFQTGFIPMYSTRTLGVAWEMWNSGQFIVPYSNGEPYSHKVPLLFWLIHVGWAIGGVGEVWPRLLQVIAGLGVILFARRLARVLWPQTTEVASLVPWIMTAFSYAFIFSLQIMYEVLLSLCVLAALNALIRRHVTQQPAFFWFGLAIAAGLMTKGPVMLLHIAFPFLLGPLWHPWAAAHRARWYAQGTLALAGGFAVLVAWALAAAEIGGEVYRNELFFMQTAGRVVDSFDHAQAWWWYLSMLPALMAPWILWPRAWRALTAVVMHERSIGMRFVACWVLPVFVAFSLISGKQAYYLLPEATAGAMVLAAGIARLRGRQTRAWRASGGWLLAALMFAMAFALWRLPAWVADGSVDSVWYVDLSLASPWFAALAAALGIVFASTPREDVAATRWIGGTAVAAMALVYALFAQTIWVRFDLRPAAAHVAALETAGVPIAHYDLYHTQLQFLARLQRPMSVLFPDTIEAWAHAHPDGRVLHYAKPLTLDDLRHAEFIQPFRSDWLIIERADSWVRRRRGEQAPLPAHPAVLAPAHYWPYRALLGPSARGTDTPG